MAKIDLVFEGGGAKGMAFVGALRELLEGGQHQLGRLLGTSSGAIVSVLLAAGYTVQEMQAALDETKDGRPVFETFLGLPKHFDQQTIDNSAIRAFFESIDFPIPDFLEEKIDDAVFSVLLRSARFRHLFSFVEYGGWYTANAFRDWLSRKLDEGEFDGGPRQFSRMRLAEFHERTGVELSLVASDTSDERMLILNHRTAPDVPVVWAARMSMSIPLLWREVVWDPDWGPYRKEDISGNIVVDGGLLSNFPISLLMSDRPDVIEMIGAPETSNVLGLLIDENIHVPDAPEKPKEDSRFDVNQLRIAKRLRRLVDTMTGAHDNMAIAVFQDHVVRLPAKGFDTTEFDMTQSRKTALVKAGGKAMKDFLGQRSSPFESLEGAIDLSVSKTIKAISNEIAGDILDQ